MNNALFVAWRSGEPTNGKWGPVGRLEFEKGIYRYSYTRGARSLAGFEPFPGMADLNTIYESEELFPLFSSRLLARSRPEYEAFLKWGGFDPENPPDPIAVLAVTEGQRATDSLELFPCPRPDAAGCYVGKFFLHGLRWVAPVSLERTSRLKVGESLGLMFDICNPKDANAVAVRTCDERERTLLGYIPRYLARDVKDLVRGCSVQTIELKVERVNLDAPLQQRLLCRLTSCWPAGFQPCDTEEFKPIAEVITAIA